VLSPDGRRVAVEIEDAETGQHVVWILGPMPGVRSRLTHAPHDGHHPTWSPDGREIAFTSTRTGKWLPYRQRADGLGEDVLIHDQPDVSQLMVRQWTPDGRAVLAVAWEADGRPRLWLLPLDGSEKARPLVDGDWGALSRDGRWLAVATRHAGHHQVYVLPFPALDTRWQVSTEGGNWPRWRSDGGELFYVSEERKLMSVAVAAAPGFDAAPPTPLFPLSLRTRDRSSNYPHEYDVDAGGQRFVTCEVPDHVASPAIMLVTDWEALLGGR
jgi:Tol biopolymer transport system component